MEVGGISGLIATNTIAQGDTREVGLDQLTKQGLTIIRAISSYKWPGAAAIEVSLVWLYRGDWKGSRVLDKHPVSHISPLLSVPGIISGMPHRLKVNEERSFQGSTVLGMGFVLTPEQAQRLIAHDPRNREVLFPYLNGEDLNSRPDQSPSRWVINFHDWPLERAQTYPEPFRILLEQVKPEREQNNRKVYRDYWWQYAEKRPALYAAVAGMNRVMVRARIANQHAVTFVAQRWVYNEKVIIFVNCPFEIIQSNIHEVWARAYSSTLKSDMQYTPSDCFETFPFPAPLASNVTEQRTPNTLSPIPDTLEALGAAYHAQRQSIMLTRQEGLTKTYNRFHDPREASADIAELRRLHVQMDQAVAAAYGWDDLDLGHGFHQTKQGLRYTISESARRAVLDRLLALNHARHAEEVAQGLHDKRASSARSQKSSRRARPPAGDEQTRLFDSE